MSRRLVMRTLLPLLLCLGLAACGGGTEAEGPGLGFGEFGLPDGPDGPVGDPPPDGGNPPPPPPPALSGGVLFTVDSMGEIFQWWVTNPQTAQDLVDVFHGTKTVVTFGGWLRGGQGAANHNAPWSWHIDPQQNGVDILTVPETPHTPSDCENHLSMWLTQGTTFIPGNGIITAYQDLR